MTQNNSYFLESLQIVLNGLHNRGVKFAEYHLANLLSGQSLVIEDEHLFVSGGIYWISYRPKTWLNDEKLCIKFERTD